MCGSLNGRRWCRGTVIAAPGEVVPFSRPRSYAEAAHNQRAERRGVVVTSLILQRCPDCGFDTVWDTKAAQWWDLDDSDYGDEGSVHP